MPKIEDSLTQKREFLWNVHGYANEYIRFADTKAAFCVGIASALMGALFASKSQELFTKIIPSHWNGLPYASLGSFSLLAISIGFAVGVIRPRLWMHSDKGFIFWEAIAHFKTASEFEATYKAKTENELNECLSHHLFSIAKVCRRKYRSLNVAIFLATLGGVLAAFVLMLRN